MSSVPYVPFSNWVEPAKGLLKGAVECAGPSSLLDLSYVENCERQTIAEMLEYGVAVRSRLKSASNAWIRQETQPRRQEEHMGKQHVSHCFSTVAHTKTGGKGLVQAPRKPPFSIRAIALKFMRITEFKAPAAESRNGGNAPDIVPEMRSKRNKPLKS
jgi:hypothetical protein